MDICLASDMDRYHFVLKQPRPPYKHGRCLPGLEDDIYICIYLYTYCNDLDIWYSILYTWLKCYV